MDIYDKLGVRKVINAWGTITAIGGSLMPPEAYQAIAEAGRSFVFLDELHRKAGQYIASLLGVEAAYVCSGAAGGMVLAAAACLTGTEAQRICALPSTEGWRNEIIVQRDDGPNYIYQAMAHTGARLVHVGTAQAMTVADIEAGLSPNTVAIMLYLHIRRQPTIAEVAPIARRAGVSLIVDAAAELPPRKNFTEPLAQGADMVIFSGGKGIAGPQGTGLVLGRKELIEACRLNANPHVAIGRPMKVGKEDIAGLIAALEVFVARDEAAETQEYKRRADYVVQQLAGLEHIEARTLMADPRARPVVPRVYVDFKAGFALTGQEVCRRMLAGELPVAIGATESGVRVDVMMVEGWQLRALAQKLRTVLEATQ